MFALEACDYANTLVTAMMTAKLDSHEKEKCGSIGLRGIGRKDVATFLKNPFQIYVCFLMVVSLLYHNLGGDVRDISMANWLGYFSTIAEGFGLLILRQKIQGRASVMGVSRNSMVMFTLTYTSRLWELWPSFSWLALDAWVVWALSVASLVVSADILWSIFMTYQKTYQEHLDVLLVKYLIPSCVGLAIVLHPNLGQGEIYSFLWTLGFYMDVAGLMPQVVMMSKGEGRVEAPIAHFVAATALSRSVDLWWWYYNFDVGPQGYWHGFNFSGWLIIVVHVLNLVLVADFMYYYVKARLSGKRLSADLELPLDNIC